MTHSTMSRTTLLVIVLVHMGITTLCMSHERIQPKFPAVLIFGDSTVDSGNNNYIPTLFRGNHFPYGVDYVDHVATGRFSNGRLVTDFLVSELGIKQSVPPFLEPFLSDEEIRTGVSFASAGSGLDDLTIAGSGVIPVSRQLGLFEVYRNRLEEIVGEEEASQIISDALILISAGANDFIFNFYDIPSRKFQFSISEYQDFLQLRLQNLIQEIYGLGGRKFAIFGLAPIGCLPFQITVKSKGQLQRKCVEEQNSDAMVYNTKLQKLVPEIQASLPGTKIVFGNIYHPIMDMLSHPQNYGFVETTKGCCGSGYLEVGPFCNLLTPICSDASKFFFWDSVHPTESVYKSIANYVLKNMLPQLD